MAAGVTCPVLDMGKEDTVKIPFKWYWDLLVGYLKPQWFTVLMLALLLFATISLQLVNPQILRYFIDTALESGALRGLYIAIILFLGAGLVNQVLSASITYVGSNVSWKATNQLRSDLLLHILRLDMFFHNAHTPGELLERIDGDVTRLANFFSQFVIRLVGNILLLGGVLVFLFYEDWRLGLSLGVFTLIYLFGHSRAQKVSVPYWRGEREANAELSGFVGERVSGVRDIKTCAAVEYVMRRYYELARRSFRKGFIADIITDVGWTVSKTIFASGYAAAMALGIYLFQRDAITIGAVYLVFHYIRMLYNPLNSIAREVEDLQRVRVSVERVRELFDARSLVSDGAGVAIPPGALEVEFRGVSFAYHPEKGVLENVSFRLQAGKVLGLLGRTGSGKTTLSRLPFRLYDPGAGSVSLGDVDIRRMRLAHLRGRVGMVTQEVQLFAASLRDNLTLFDPTIDDEKILQSLYVLGLEGWLHSLPIGLDSELAPDGGGLSAGEGQMLAFARVFLKDPGLVILDEASSRLDPASERLLEAAMDVLLENRTAIIIAHRLSTVHRADEIMILDEKGVKEYGEYDRLVDDPHSLFYNLLRTGLEEVLV